MFAFYLLNITYPFIVSCSVNILCVVGLIVGIQENIVLVFELFNCNGKQSNTSFRGFFLVMARLPTDL